MRDDPGLFGELETLYAGAGSDAASFRRLERGARRAEDDLHAYYREVARDYVERLERRLSRPQAKLNDEERALLRAWLGVAPFDERGERKLLADLAELRATFERLAALRATPLSPDSLERLRETLGDLERRSADVAVALEAKQAARALEEELGSAEKPFDREALLARIRRSLLESGEERT
jgi:hypothetical protein